MTKETSNPPQYAQLTNETSPVEEITPGELNQPVDVPELPENYQPPADEPWSTGIFDCSRDTGSCTTGLFCPCVLFGHNFERVIEGAQGYQACIGYALLVEGSIALAVATAALALHGTVDLGITSLVCEGLFFSWLMFETLCSFMRRTLQKKYHLQDSPCDPCMVHCCLHWCALCQEHRELKERLPHDITMPITAVNPPRAQVMNYPLDRPPSPITVVTPPPVQKMTSSSTSDNTPDPALPPLSRKAGGPYILQMLPL